MSKQPPPALTASTVGPCPTIIQTVGLPDSPALEDYPDCNFWILWYFHLQNIGLPGALKSLNNLIIR